MYIDWYLRGCENVRKLLKLRLVVVEGGMATLVCCAESQNTGSPPLLSDLYWVYVCWMEHEGPSVYTTIAAVAAVTPGHPNQSLCPVCVGVQRREGGPALNRWLAELLSGYETGHCGRPRSTGPRLRVHSKRETRALHLFFLAVFFRKSCSKRPERIRNKPRCCWPAIFASILFSDNEKGQRLWAKACDRTYMHVGLWRTTSHVKT